MHTLLQAIQREYGTADVFEAIERQKSLGCTCNGPKWVIGHQLLRNDPSKWFRGIPIDDRDLALINASPVSWIDFGRQSYLKHVADQPFKTTYWTVENGNALRVNVNIPDNFAPGVTWGLLSGRPSKARVLAGPCETCDGHPWDIMILQTPLASRHTSYN
ncbi:putative aaa family atpase [Diaporthe ampelina]|uniref:Putative aaa family atpase n=1 Tax=Diaporthe ampelina TaxID=1214573 RepID=A0A0G2HS35_9PEZI|nr:putative aaa family atpase [Diaporthe ampelina]